MPMIDVYAPNDLLPSGSDRRIGEALTLAALRAIGPSYGTLRDEHDVMIIVPPRVCAVIGRDPS